MKILIAIVVFSLIIIIHELGHFILAKKNGVYVTEFSIGMGPRIVSTVKGETRYSVKLFPFGGSCMMLGEDEDIADDERAFGKKNVWQRISIIAAGPIFNFILAFVISLFVIGIVGYDPANISNVAPNSPAEAAGLEVGDRIVEFDGHKVDISRDYQMYHQFNALTSEPIEVKYVRDGKKSTTTLTPVQVEKYMLGFSYSGGEGGAEVLSITEGQPLSKAGVKVGDVITSINGTPIASGNEFSSYFASNPLKADPITMTYRRGDVENEITVTPQFITTVYTTGLSINEKYVKTNVWGVIKYSAIEVKFWIRTTIESLGLLIRGKVSTNDLSGPVGLVDTIGNVYENSKQYGFLNVFVSIGSLVIFISANLGVMNLLPIPALDGGRLVFMFLEVIRGGKQIPKEKEGMVHMIGLIALMLLMVFVMFNDIMKLFH